MARRASREGPGNASEMREEQTGTMWRGSKAVNSAQAHMEQRGARRQSSNTLADAYPGLRSLSINLSFASTPGAPNPRRMRLLHSPSSRAFFEFKCPNWKCELGGYDLGPAVERCVKGKRKTASGTIECQGWCDAHHEKDRCTWVLSYEIQVT